MNDEVKRLEFSDRIFVMLLVTVIGILGYLGTSLIMRVQERYYRPELSFMGEGKAFAKPDVALLTLGATTEGKDIKLVLKRNTEKMNAVMGELKSLGIEEKDIQTTKYNLVPNYEFTKAGQRIFKGYLLEQEVRIKIRDFEKIDQVIVKSTEAGANIIGNLSFKIDDPESVRQEARSEAIEKAKAKAEKVAKELGLKLGKIVNIYEEYPYAEVEMLKTPSYGAGETVSPISPEIQPGQEEVTVRVTLIFRAK